MPEAPIVPDEQAIGRARAALFAFAEREWGWGSKEYPDIELAVEVVLTAILDGTAA